MSRDQFKIALFTVNTGDCIVFRKGMCISYICTNDYIFIYMVLKQKLNNSRRKITSREVKLEDKSVLVILSVIHAG